MLQFMRENAAFLLAGGILTFTSSFGQTFFISIFAGEIKAEFGLSDGDWGYIYTLGTTLSALVFAWAGTLVDRFRVKGLALTVLPGLAFACLSMAFVPSGLWLIGVVFLLRIFGQGMTSHLATVAMARWFIARRGMALSLAAMGFALGQAVLPLAFEAMKRWFDWHTLWVIAAVIVCLILPVVLRLLRLERTPQSIATEAEVAGMDGRHWTRPDVLRHPIFWLMVPALIGPPAWGTALFFHQVHLAEVKGWTMLEWLSLMPVFTAVMVCATLLSGQAIDRFGATRLMSVFMLPYGIAFAVIGIAPGIWVAGLGLLILGLGQGMMGTVPSAFWAELFGTRHIGSIKAGAAALMVFGSAIGPGITGQLIDWGIDFPTQSLALALYFAVGGGFAALATSRARSALAAAA